MIPYINALWYKHITNKKRSAKLNVFKITMLQRKQLGIKAILVLLANKWVQVILFNDVDARRFSSIRGRNFEINHIECLLTGI